MAFDGGKISIKLNFCCQNDNITFIFKKEFRWLKIFDNLKLKNQYLTNFW